jgi:hypothetical protein
MDAAVTATKYPRSVRPEFLAGKLKGKSPKPRCRRSPPCRTETQRSDKPTCERACTGAYRGLAGTWAWQGKRWRVILISFDIALGARFELTIREPSDERRMRRLDESRRRAVQTPACARVSWVIGQPRASRRRQLSDGRMPQVLNYAAFRFPHAAAFERASEGVPEGRRAGGQKLRRSAHPATAPARDRV